MTREVPEITLINIKTSGRSVFPQGSDKLPGLSIHKGVIRWQTVALPQHGFFLPQFRDNKSRLSNFLPIWPDAVIDRDSSLGLRFDLWHKIRTLGEVKNDVTGKVAGNKRRDRRSE